jgi:deoxyribodipyrimidine photo-lyase
MYLHWHRRDLRAADNRALQSAVSSATDSTVLPVFVFDDAVLSHGSPPRVAFMLEALASLRAWYRRRDSDLLVAHGDPRELLAQIADEHDAAGLTWAADYSGLARERDAAVRQALDEADIVRERVHDAVLHEPGTIRTNDGDPYQVFTYFSRKWHDRPKNDPVDPPTAEQLADVTAEEPLPSLSDLGFEAPAGTVPPAGTEHARERLTSFCDSDIYDYAERRDYPADDCTSRLSAALKWGTVGIREVYEETAAAKAIAPDDAAAESVEEFQDQLAWREFYTQVLFFNPAVVTANYSTYEHDIAWREDPDGLQAWKDGETGYPIVDAGMRQLREEAYMHNRVRMLVASFLTKDLLIDWRRGYDWFREQLVDHDTANDTGGWQWAASTGTDAQPYFRVFNPTTQGERYDPDAAYIKRQVPELRDVEPSVIHDWPDLSGPQRRRAAPDYPAPIVDHSERREAAIEMFERARGDA